MEKYVYYITFNRDIDFMSFEIPYLIYTVTFTQLGMAVYVVYHVCKLLLCNSAGLVPDYDTRRCWCPVGEKC